mgnify:CR=1 FL=1
MFAKAISILTWPLRNIPALIIIWLQRRELRILRVRWEDHLKTLPEDEQRRERAEVETELAKARKEVMGEKAAGGYGLRWGFRCR